MRTAHEIIAATSAAAVLLAAGGAVPALGAPAAPAPTHKPATKTKTKAKTKAKTTKLTKTAAAADARADAEAGATISGGDKVVITDCRTYGRSAFKCDVQLLPAASASRCTWTDTIRLVAGKPAIRYSDVACSG